MDKVPIDNLFKIIQYQLKRTKIMDLINFVLIRKKQ